MINTERIGDQSTLGQVIALVTEAPSGRRRWNGPPTGWPACSCPPFSDRTADHRRLAIPRRGGHVGIGYLPALAVLVVACPCPLILATPSAVMAAMAWLAREGVVVKGSEALERLARVDTFAFDKTGTLLREPTSDWVWPAPGRDSSRRIAPHRRISRTDQRTCAGPAGRS
ncbi:MAG: hypothetical protein Ct9H300mP1_13500 [Planctomycetaceae bacterium]|nr:MAG: hypothetical protein Ct9H300mP1_13500 [Planctomycetaceae bacterium]